MQLQNSTKDQLRAIVARIERLEEEKAALAADLHEVYAEAKGNGFDVKAALRAVICIRKQDENKWRRRWRCSTPISMRSAWRGGGRLTLNGIGSLGLTATRGRGHGGRYLWRLPGQARQ